MLTFVGDVWGFALGTLLDQLLAWDYPPPFEYEEGAELREPRAENSHAVAAVVVLAAIIEAYVRHAVHKELGGDAANRNGVADMLGAHLARVEGGADVPSLVDEIAELFEARNAILHSHEWWIDRGRWKTDAWMGRRPGVVAERLVGRGKLSTAAPDRWPKSGLNRIPTWVDVGDVLIGLGLAAEVLELLERNDLVATPVIVPLCGEPQPLAMSALKFENAIRARGTTPAS